MPPSAVCAEWVAPTSAATAPPHRPPLQGEPTLWLHEEHAIRRNAWFAGLEPALQRVVLAACSVRRVRAGTVIERGHIPAQTWDGLAQGAVRLSAPMDSGRSLTLSLLGPGHWFGDGAVLDGSTLFEAQACTDVTLLWMPGATLRHLLTLHPMLGMALVQLHHRRTRLLTAQLTAAVSLSLRQRLAHLLLHMARRFGDVGPGGQRRLWVKLSQRDLSDMLGVSRQRLNMCFKQLEREQAVGVERGHLVLSPGDWARVAQGATGMLGA